MNATTYEPTLEQVRREIAELEARINRLRRIEKALRGVRKTPEPTRLILPPDFVVPLKKAPKYFMEDTLLKQIFAARGWLSNADVRSALRKLDYPFTIDNHQVRKTLARLVSTGQLFSKHERGFVFFSQFPPASKKKG